MGTPGPPCFSALPRGRPCSSTAVDPPGNSKERPLRAMGAPSTQVPTCFSSDGILFAYQPHNPTAVLRSPLLSIYELAFSTFSPRIPRIEPPSAPPPPTPPPLPFLGTYDDDDDDGGSFTTADPPAAAVPAAFDDEDDDDDADGALLEGPRDDPTKNTSNSTTTTRNPMDPLEVNFRFHCADETLPHRQRVNQQKKTAAAATAATNSHHQQLLPELPQQYRQETVARHPRVLSALVLCFVGVIVAWGLFGGGRGGAVGGGSDDRDGNVGGSMG